MDKNLIGVLHPGEMGAAVGGCFSQRGLTVLWASVGRSPATAARAAAAGMRDVGSASEMAGSWWPDWHRWILAHDKDEVPARVPGAGGLPAIEPAPGSYVKVKAS